MGFVKLLGTILQQAFLQSAGSWGAGIVIDENGHIIDALEDYVEDTVQIPTQKASVRIIKKQRAKEIE